MNRPDRRGYIHISEYLEALEAYTNWLEVRCRVMPLWTAEEPDDSDVVCCDDEDDYEFSAKEEVIRYFMNKISDNLATIVEVLDD